MSICSTGTLAVYNTVFSGLIPATCVGVEVTTKDSLGFEMRVPRTIVKLRLNIDRRAYKKGEIIEASPLDAIPQTHVRQGQYFPYFLWGYKWQPTT